MGSKSDDDEVQKLEKRLEYVKMKAKNSKNLSETEKKVVQHRYGLCGSNDTVSESRNFRSWKRRNFRGF